MEVESTPAAPLAPTSAPERIQILDVLRGFALFGILLVNMAFFMHPFQYATLPFEHANQLDATIAWLIRVLAEGKFYSLFSLLFGIGFMLQWQRAQAKGRPFVGVYLRRSLALLLIGFLHATLVWVGDILMIYAVVGLLLLLFRNTRPRRLLIWVGILVLLPTLFMAASWGLIVLGSQDPAVAAEIEASFVDVRQQTAADLAQAYTVYASGNFAEITAQRLRDLRELGVFTLFTLPNILAMFLLGVYFAKQNILADLPAHRLLFRRLLIWGGSVGLVLNILYANFVATGERDIPTFPMVIATAAQAIGAPLLMLAYVGGLALLWMGPGQRRLRPLAPTGRMALTNYLMQSIMATTIFYGYGLGWFGQVGATVGLLLTFVIYGIEVAWSGPWLTRFRFGPAEWFWRTLTYLRLQPMRLPRT
jgi:uncharacterized protein